MICPHCEIDTPAARATCVHCGESLDITFDEMEKGFEERDLRRLEQVGEDRARQWLAMAVVFLLVVVAFRIALVPSAPAPAVEPAYLLEPTEAELLPLELPLERAPRDPLVLGDQDPHCRCASKNAWSSHRSRLVSCSSPCTSASIPSSRCSRARCSISRAARSAASAQKFESNPLSV